MNSGKILWICLLIAIADIGSGNDLGSLINGVTSVEEIKLNDNVIENTSDKINYERDIKNKISVTYKGEGSLSTRRSTGIASGIANDLLNIIDGALGSRYRLLASLKRGGRLLTLKSERKLKAILDSNLQNVSIFINGNLVDLSKASLIETTSDSSVLEPDGHVGIKITLSSEGAAVKSVSDNNEIKIETTKGLNKIQVKKLEENFYDIVAKKASRFTGLPKPMIELMLAGRETMVDRLSDVLSPVERVVVGGQIVKLDKTKAIQTSSEIVLEPPNLPQVKVTWKRDGSIHIESKDGKSIYLEYSNGIAPRIVGKLVDNLHRTITQRVGMISWSNKIVGSIPLELDSTINELKSNIQKRKIFVNGNEVDFNLANVIKTTDESVLYRLPSGVHLKVHYDGTVATEGGESLTLEATPGISETQAANILGRVNQIFSTAIGFSTDTGETLLNDESNRRMLQTLLKGIKHREEITIDYETISLSNATISKKQMNYTEYTMESFDDVILTKFTGGDLKVSGKGRTLKLVKSSGLSLGFLNKLVKAINNVMPRKRWFYNFGNKNYFKGERLQSIIDDIPKMIQKQTVLIDGKEIDLIKATILSIDDLSTVYTPETNSDVKITKFTNGAIQASTGSDDAISLHVTTGITLADADTLINNIKSVVGNNFKIGSKRPNNFWCSGGVTKLFNWLLNDVFSKSNINIESDDGDFSDLISFSTRSLDKKEIKSGFTITDYNGRGKNVTSSKGGKVVVDVSTGLTQEITSDLVEYLIPLLDSKEDVIKMVTGSFPDYKVRKIKDLINKMIQNNVISVDSLVVSPYNSVLVVKKSDYTVYRPNEQRDVSVKTRRDGIIEIDGPKYHKVSVAVSPGITEEQAEQIYKNIRYAFKEKFSEITKIPSQFVDFLSALKRYYIKSYFYYAAPPKEFVSVNGKEIRLQNSSPSDNATDLDHSIKLDDTSGIDVQQYPDGSLKVTSSHGGNIDIIRTSGMTDDQINQLLKTMEYRLGLRNKMLRIADDKLSSPPDKPEYLGAVLKGMVVSERVFIDEDEVNMNKAQNVQTYDSCSLYKLEYHQDLIVKRCQDGQISLDYRRNESISLQILPGISQEQAKHILKSLITTIKTKSGNIKIMANFPDIFLQLLADGRLKSIDNLISVFIPREDITVDGKRIILNQRMNQSTNASDLIEEKDYEITELDAYPGLQVLRFSNGSIEVKSWTASNIDVTINSGFSFDLINFMISSLKHQTNENLTPYLILVDEIVKNFDSKTMFYLIDTIVQSQDAGTNLNEIMDILEKEMRRAIHSFNINEKLLKNIALSAIQKQQVFINDDEVDFNRATLVESRDGYTTYKPESYDNIMITKHANGRIVAENSGEDLIAVRISAGLPKNLLLALTQSVQRLMQKLDTDEDYINKIRTQLESFTGNFYNLIMNGITERRRILRDGELIELIKENQIDNSELNRTYKQDNTLVTIDVNGGTRVESTYTTKLELDISHGLVSEPVISYLTNNSLDLAKEVLQTYNNLDTMVPLMTKMEKIVDGMIKSLQQTVEIYINFNPINLSTMKVQETTLQYTILSSSKFPGLKITSYVDGRIAIETPDRHTSIEVYISRGLTPTDLGKLSSNIDKLFSNLNPLELLAYFFDVLPKNFFILAQNMDRVLSVMNLIQI